MTEIIISLFCDRCDRVIGHIIAAASKPIEAEKRRLMRGCRGLYRKVRGEVWCNGCAVSEGYKLKRKASNKTKGA